MASIIKANLNLAAIPKDKIYKGKKGSYLPITITINDELGNYGDNGPIIVEQSKEEREAKVDKVYLGNVKIISFCFHSSNCTGSFVCHKKIN